MRLIWPADADRGAEDLTDGDLTDEQLSDLYGRSDRPSLRMNFVSSLDGAVDVGGYSEGLSGPADKRVFGLLRQLSDAVVVGAGTLRHEGYRAVRLDERRRAWREEHGLPAFPTLVVVSASLDVDPAQGAFADAPVRPLVITHAQAPAHRRARVEAVADLLVHGEREVDLPAALADLRARGLTQLLCEGGPQLFGGLLAAGLVDELCLTVSPLLTGPGAGRIIAGRPRDATLGMRLVHILTADDTLITRYIRAD
jgi:riboflavin biosynthesis pyrimidine reductase